MGTADNAMGGSYGAREFSPGEWANARWRRHGGSRWTAFEIIAMVLGFIVFWPIGLAILGYKFWQSRYGGPDLQTLATNKWQDARTMMSSKFLVGMRRRDEAREAATMRPRPAMRLSTSGGRPSWPASTRSAASSTRRSAISPNMSRRSAAPRTARSSSGSWPSAARGRRTAVLSHATTVLRRTERFSSSIFPI